MPLLFTVRWPLFARLEAILVFSVAVRLAGEIELIRTYVDRRWVGILAPYGMRLGLSNQTTFWVAMAIAGIVPFFIVLVVADRLLTVRKGFALLSVVAISFWTWAGYRLAWLLPALVTERLLGGVDSLTFDQKGALAMGGLAFLLHLGALWTGLRDRGDVAERLIAARQARIYSRESDEAHAQDVYYRQTADIRGWQPRKQPDVPRVGPREHPAVKFLYGITWAGVIVGVGTAYLAWNGFPVFGPGAARLTPSPEVASGPVKPGTAMKTATAVPMPAIQSAPPMPQVPMPQVNAHAAATVPLPAVQHPSELSASVQSGSNISGPNEAVAERDNDGSFAFDAVVNGTHVRMLFDTGASVVGLRAEDAVRLGIPVSRLNYSVKIKTANGTADVAPVMLDTMMIGNITLRNVPGFVAKEGMLQQNLLGQTFLARLSGFNVEHNLLVLRGR